MPDARSDFIDRVQPFVDNLIDQYFTALDTGKNLRTFLQQDDATCRKNGGPDNGAERGVNVRSVAQIHDQTHQPHAATDKQDVSYQPEKCRCKTMKGSVAPEAE